LNLFIIYYFKLNFIVVSLFIVNYVAQLMLILIL